MPQHRAHTVRAADTDCTSLLPTCHSRPSCYNQEHMNISRTNQEWLKDLGSSGPSQEAAIADLRDILLRAAYYSFGRHASDLEGLASEETTQRAEDSAQDALIAVMAHLGDFRGESKF